MLFCQSLLGMVVSINSHLFPPTPSIACSFIYYISEEPSKANKEICSSLFAVFSVFRSVFSQSSRHELSSVAPELQENLQIEFLDCRNL